LKSYEVEILLKSAMEELQSICK